MKSRVLIAVIALLTSFVTLPAFAQEAAAPAQDTGTPGKFERYGGYSDRFFIQFGAYFPGHNTIMQLDTDFTGGSSISLEDDIDLPDSTTDLRVEGYVRFGKRHRLRLGYVSMGRETTHRLERDITWGGITYPIDVEITGRWNTDVIKAEYRFSVVKSQQVDLGLSLGVFGMSVDSALGAPRQDLETVQTDKSAPLPMAGIDLEYSPIENLLLRAGGQWLGVEIGTVDGSWYDARLSAEYYLLKHLGIGVGYNWSRVDVDAELDERLLSRFAFDYRFDGPQIFLIGVF